MKSLDFDKEYYLKNNIDVAQSCTNPIKHYVRHGWKEGRNPNQYFNTRWYLNAYPDLENSGINPLYHYIIDSSAKGLVFSHKNKISLKSNMTNLIKILLVNNEFKDGYSLNNEFVKTWNIADRFKAWQAFNKINNLF